jgi:hypothetical protein
MRHISQYINEKYKLAQQKVTELRQTHPLVLIH